MFSGEFYAKEDLYPAVATQEAFLTSDIGNQPENMGRILMVEGVISHWKREEHEQSQGSTMSMECQVGLPG